MTLKEIIEGTAALLKLIPKPLSLPQISLTRANRPLGLGDFILKGFNLTVSAREQLERSEIIPVGGTEAALFRLVGSATRDTSILALCGHKGDYSVRYYQENFLRAGVVKRVFSYDAIIDEFKNKQERYALAGLKMHLDQPATSGCKIEVFLLPKGRRIKQTIDTFDPPLSFGLAILQNNQEQPLKAVVHWEVDAAGLKDLISIEGFVIDDRQTELLSELVRIHQQLLHSNKMLSSEFHRDDIVAACDELEDEFRKSGSTGQGATL